MNQQRALCPGIVYHSWPRFWPSAVAPSIVRPLRVKKIIILPSAIVFLFCHKSLCYVSHENKICLGSREAWKDDTSSAHTYVHRVLCLLCCSGQRAIHATCRAEFATRVCLRVRQTNRARQTVAVDSSRHTKKKCISRSLFPSLYYLAGRNLISLRTTVLYFLLMSL